MKRKWRIGRVGLVALLLAATGAATLNQLNVQGFWDESQAVHIKADRIESSTLAIGTHLIHLSALTEAIYDVANESAEESGQGTIYYKSELGGNAWFDITEASSLADITTGGAPVTNEEIEALFFTHHTKSDKVTYDLRTNKAVNIFDIRDPYDLETMEEMSPLKMKYDQIIEGAGKNDITKRIDKIWATRIKGSDAPASIVEQEENLEALQKYLNVLTENKAPAQQTEKVSAVMDAVDAARRYEVFKVLEPVLEEYLNEINKELSNPPKKKDDEEPGSTVDSELLSAVSETISNVQNALITYDGERLSEGVSVISGAEYDFSMDLINDAKAPNHAACDVDVSNLIHLGNIQNNVISDRPQEIALLENRLLGDGTNAYMEVLGRGESAEYRANKAQNASQALLNRFIGEFEGDAQTARGELEFLIQAKCDRIANADAMTFVEERLVLTTETFYTGIPGDDFAETATISVEDHIVFLTDLRRSLELALGGNELDALVAEKAELQEKMMDALDHSDLEAAKELEEAIAAVEEEIRAAEEETAAQIAQLQEEIAGMEDGSAKKAAAQAELAALESGLSDGTLGAAIAGLKKEALEAIQDGEDASSAVDALSDMLSAAPNLVLPALQEVYNELLLSEDGTDDVSDALERVIADLRQAVAEDADGSLDGGQINDVFDHNKTRSDQLKEVGQALLSAAADGLDGGQIDDILSDFEPLTPDVEDLSGLLDETLAMDGDGRLSADQIQEILDGSGTLEDMVQELADRFEDALAADEDGQLDDQQVEDIINGILPVPTPASANQALISTIEQAILENPNALRDQLSAAQIRENVRLWLLERNQMNTGSSSPLSGVGGISRKSAYYTLTSILALQMYYDETANPGVLQVMGPLVQEQLSLGNQLFYQRISDSTGEYLPLSAIQVLTNRRYVWNKNASLGVLAYGADYYGFTVYSDRVGRDRDGAKTETMARPAKYQNGVHIPEEYAYDQFGVQAVYLSDSTAGIICDDPALELAQELLDRLLEA